MGMGKLISYFFAVALVVSLLTLISGFNGAEKISGYFLLDLDHAAIEKSSPHDRIKEDQIKVYGSLIIMHINGSELVSLENTNSMDPLIDENSSIIQIKPKFPEDIHIGDIVSYEYGHVKKIALHRVIAVGEDSEGKFFILKGDNVDSVDPVKVRFEQIKGVLVAVLY